MTRPGWRFFRAGGVDQVQLTRGAELAALDQLDQKLWVALSCPVSGLEFDERTLALIDGDGDGRVRAPELIAAAKWAAGLLVDVEQLAAGSDTLPLAAIDVRSDEGRLIHDTARALLDALGERQADGISVAQAVAAAEAFAREPANGDGVVPAAAAGDLGPVVGEILGASAAPPTDRSGAPGVDRAAVEAFFAAVAARLAWLTAGKDAAVRPLGDATDGAWTTLQAVAPKVDDFFSRCRVAAWDARAGAAFDHADAFAPLAGVELDRGASALAPLPLATVAPDAPLPLVAGLNPAWADAIAALRDRVVAPLLGARDTLSRSEWIELVDRLAPYTAWRAAEAGQQVASLGEERLRALVDGDTRDRLLALVAADEAAAGRAAAIVAVERLVRYQRDLLTLANNFVSFRDFYGRRGKAIFQVGTLYLDQRACELCIAVNDAGRHASMAHLSKAYLVYCDLRNAKGETRSIVALVTDGDVDNLMVGRNGLFYDRRGRDWDATVTRIVDNPISVRQAFWAPYKKLIRLVEDQINARMAAAAAEADKAVESTAARAGAAAKGEAPAAAPKKLDVGVVAALGVAVGGITAAIGALLEAFFGLGMWMPLGVLGLVLLISGPSVAVAWVKLRQRNLGPILDANGWAVNALARVNVPHGRSLTSVAALPAGSSRDLVDPFAEAQRPWGALAAAAVLLIGAFSWYLGSVDPYLPLPARSVAVLGELAPAYVPELVPAPDAAASPEPAPADPESRAAAE